MKKLFTLLAITLFGVAMWSCSYDDDDLWKKVDDLDDRVTNLENALAQMNKDIIRLEGLINAIDVGDPIMGFSAMDSGKGWIVTFASGKIIELYHGKDGQDAQAPIITVLAEEGIYYWAITIDGKTDFMYADDAKTQKIPVTGQDGTTPEIGVDEEGYWTVNGDRVQWKGKDLPATTEGYTYLFTDVVDNGRYYTFYLADGTTIDVVKRLNASIKIDAEPTEHFKFGQSRIFQFTTENAVALAGAATGPMDWTVSASFKDNAGRLRIIAPAADGWELEGTVTVGVVGSDGAVVTASIYVTSSSYELRYLTFEDEDYKGTQGVNYWSSLIDTPQYGGPLLYPSSDNVYNWYDQGNTEIAHRFTDEWGDHKFWGGGEAISNYVEQDVDSGDFQHQLAIYYKHPETGFGGHNGSRNFCVHYGYRDDSGYGGTKLQAIWFEDGVARVVDHMYVTATTYLLNCVVSGNGLTDPVGPDGFVRLVAIGFDENGAEITSVQPTFEIANYERTVIDWQKWDLSELGKVSRIEFNVTGDSDNGYGFSQPAYFAWDDLAVRFE